MRTLCQPGHKGALFAFKSERKSTKMMQPCVQADTEEPRRSLIVE